MQILFAPLQGYTDHPYRRFHHQLVGCVDEYYTPFLRWGKDGLRNKDLRDILPDNNQNIPLAVQLIARDNDEFRHLCDIVQQQGWQRIDLNMGCPFPMQTHAGRGAALLAHPDRVEPILLEMQKRPEVAFSIKMRLGFDSLEQSLRLIPMIDSSVVRHLVLHPRLALQQYKGTPDIDSFARFHSLCSKPLFFNGDLATVQDVQSIMLQFPSLQGVMLGRGILADPLLPRRLLNKDQDIDALAVLRQLHDALLGWATHTLQGDHQVLARMHVFWEYAQPTLGHKTIKKIKKAKFLADYRAAVATISWPVPDRPRNQK